MDSQRVIRRALLSVTDKSGLVEFARTLHAFGVELVSTGGTAKALRSAGLPVRDVSDLTGFPEMLEGRVKTLHPKVHGGLLHKRGDAGHVAAVQAHGIEPIDLVVVNLYAFEATASRDSVTLDELIENIDIGGPSMLRSAAKNFADVAVVSSAADYEHVREELQQHNGALSLATRWTLARKAFALTAAYDSAIATALERLPADGTSATPSDAFPTTLRLQAPQLATLRYGENPHQAAALYGDGSGRGIAAAEQLHGKELSFNNLVDLDACWALASELPGTAVAIISTLR